MSTTTQTNTTPRFTAELKVDPKFMSALIGVGGSNIRRITSTVKTGCYIRGNDGVFTISAYTQDAVKAAAKMLKMDEIAMKDPSKAGSKPTGNLEVSSNIAPIIVGKGGHNIKAIMATVGDGCFIVYSEGAFRVTANDELDVQTAINIIRSQVANITGETYRVISSIPAQVPVVSRPSIPQPPPPGFVGVYKIPANQVIYADVANPERPTVTAEAFPTIIKKKKIIVPKKGIWADTQRTSKVIEEVSKAETFADPIGEKRAAEARALAEEKQRFERQKYQVDLSELDDDDPDYIQTSSNFASSPIYDVDPAANYIHQVFSSGSSWADINDE